MSHVVHPRWETLLHWLRQSGMDTSDFPVEIRKTTGAGYGLFALREIPPSTPLFQVPAKTMINVRTLVRLYPEARPALTATQIISLHLLLYRPSSPNDLSKDTVFGPYISILPSDFDGHPLTWLIRIMDPLTEHKVLDIIHDLLKHTSTGVMHALKGVAVRFRNDWKRVCQYLQENVTLLAGAKERGRNLLPLDSVLVKQEFLWGWLNVNTRSVYHRLCSSRADPGNITMCPVFDFGNHTNNQPHAYPEPSRAEALDQAPSNAFGHDFVLLSPKDKTLYPGEEIHLKYGAHSNRTLFTEYGFVNDLDQNALVDGQLYCEADVTWQMTRLFAERRNIGTWMEGLLRSTNYWGEWAIYSKPEPSHPSFRLISALRLYHAIPPEMSLPPHDDHELVWQWRETISGRCHMISSANESSWRETLDKLCLGIVKETGNHLDALDKVGREWVVDSWVHHDKKCLLMLLQEERYAAQCVHLSLERGEEF